MNNLITREPTLREKMTFIDEFAKTLPKVDLSRQKEIEDAGLLATVDLRVEHQFSFGVYARTLYIPKGVVLTGQIHKFENFNILLKGRLQVSINNEIQELEAPFSYVAPSNSRRIFRALEDSIWMTVIGTHEKDIKIIEGYFVAESEDKYLEFLANQPKLPGF